jgi:hypothetical protein
MYFVPKTFRFHLACNPYQSKFRFKTVLEILGVSTERIIFEFVLQGIMLQSNHPYKRFPPSSIYITAIVICVLLILHIPVERLLLLL